MYKPRESKVFGLALKQLLEERSLSQRKFAKQAGLTTDYVSKLVNGEIAEPRQKNRCKIAKGLGITERELLEYVAQYGKLEAEETAPSCPDSTDEEKASTNEYTVNNPLENDAISQVSIGANSFLEYFAKAIDQLESKHIHVRIGAISYLGKLAKSSQPEDHWTVMEYLAAFIRNAPPRREAGIPDDIQEALTVIGRRDIEKDPENQKLDLRKVNIAGANLREAQLQGVNFDHANLQGAILKKANLKEANFYNTNLQGAHLWKAYFQEANFMEANLQEAILSNATMQKAKLWGTKLQGASLTIANLEEADLSQADLNRANLQWANFMGAKLQEVNFAESNLQGTKLQGADLTNAKNLDSQEILAAYGDSRTILPEDVVRPAHWK